MGAMQRYCLSRRRRVQRLLSRREQGENGGVFTSTVRKSVSHAAGVRVDASVLVCSVEVRVSSIRRGDVE